MSAPMCEKCGGPCKAFSTRAEQLFRIRDAENDVLNAAEARQKTIDLQDESRSWRDADAERAQLSLQRLQADEDLETAVRALREARK